ncbi:hypothetical protein AWZ03_014920 [Drosophila navojoa]|uniref:Uncharacterized protein n=1 Tax=Drosophila navojoa TaxID=7232 RepID=A0A484AQH6_DRONA|nr:hypothetical protein AWZ03_014920 [Drosophila navojoa]
MLTITLAKSNTINPTIFDHDDLKSVLVENPTDVPLVIILPVSHEHTVLQLQDDTVAECENDVLAVSSCTTTTHTSFCKIASRDTCAQALHAGGKEQCYTQPSQLAPITYVDDGIMVINERPARVSTDDGPEIQVNGTYLITYEHMAIINGTKFANRRKALDKLLGIAASPLIHIISHDPVLSMPLPVLA